MHIILIQWSHSPSHIFEYLKEAVVVIAMVTIMMKITNVFFFYSSSYYYNYSFIFFILEIPVIRSAEYKLPITREICICMFSLYIKMKF